MPQFCPAAERMGMQMTRKQKYRRVLLALAALFLILAVLLGYDAMRESLPDTMYVDENSESPFQPLTKHPLLTISEDTKEAEKTEFGETGETVVECSAAGIPLKKIRVIQEERPKVAVCGAPVGIYMETDGVMVIRTAEIRSSDGTVSRPSENILREGDYITKVNGQSIRSKQDLIDAVKVSNGSPVYLSLLRDGETIEVQVTPQKSQDGTCRLGAWVRDNMQGIGTLTFVEPDGTFAALGHGISDIDTGKMLQLNGGELYRYIKQKPDLNYMPVILLTSCVDDTSMEEGYKMGAEAYITKPFDMDLLFIQIQNIMHNHNFMKNHYATIDIPIQKQENLNYINEQLMIQFNRIINENISNVNMDVNFIAQQMGMSRASLYNKTKGMMDMGISEYIIKCRLEYARKLLDTTTLSIGEVAEQTGFKHSRNFSTVFKNIVGMSPSDYRKKDSRPSCK